MCSIETLFQLPLLGDAADPGHRDHPGSGLTVAKQLEGLARRGMAR